MVLYRFGVWAREQSPPVRQLAFGLYRAAATLCRNIYGIEVSATATIGRRFWIAHQSGIVIGNEVVIGDDCMVRQNVTIGADQAGSQRQPPSIGEGVELGAGAVVLAGVTIGDRARIGPNAVVMKDVPADGSAFATPARTMSPLRQDGPTTV